MRHFELDTWTCRSLAEYLMSLRDISFSLTRTLSKGSCGGIGCWV